MTPYGIFKQFDSCAHSQVDRVFGNRDDCSMKASGLLPKLRCLTIVPKVTLTAIAFTIAVAAHSQDKPASPSVKEALEIYAKATGRAILRPTSIPEASEFLLLSHGFVT